MFCYKCGEPVYGDNLQCEECRNDENYRDSNLPSELDDYYESEVSCEFCCAEGNDPHAIKCPNNESGYARLMRDGYD